MRFAIPAVLLVLFVSALACADPDTAAEAGSAIEATATAAPGQGVEIAGGIEATLGEQEMSWNVLSMDGEDGPESSSTYRIRPAFGDSLLILTLSGYAGDRPTVPGMISITLALPGVPESCPCEVHSQSVEYWAGVSEIYRSTGTTLTVDRIEHLSGDVYRASGSFSGVMAAEGSFEGAEGPRPIEGTFSIDRIVRSEAGR